MGDAEMRAFLRRMKHELSAGRDATLMLAIIASFIAWIVTDLLRIIFS
jgi:GTPase